MKKINDIGFSLQTIKTEQFAIIEENYSQKKEIKLNSELTFKLNKEDKRIGVFLTFSFTQGKKTFIKIQTSCHFLILPEHWELLLKDNKVIIPKNFISHITIISIGNTRGILHAKSEGTGFNKFILPQLDVTQLVKEDIEFIVD